MTLDEKVELAVSVLMDTHLVQIFDVTREVLELLEIQHIPVEAAGVALIEAVRCSPISAAAYLNVEACVRRFIAVEQEEVG